MRSNSIIARADALMNRRRQTIPPEEVPILVDAIEEDEDDIPVLVDTESAPRASATPPNPPPPQAEAPWETPPVSQHAPHEDHDQAHDEMVVRELTRRISKRLVAELPRLIEATLREFVAEQEEIARQQSDD